MARVKKKRQMTTRGRLIILGPICVFLMLWFVYTMFSYTTSLYKLQQQKKQLEAEYLNLQEVADDLKTEITKLQDPEYLAKYAREHYSYSKEGELIIKIHEQQQEIAVQEDSVEWNQKMVRISLTAIGLIFLYIIIRSTKKKKPA